MKFIKKVIKQILRQVFGLEVLLTKNLPLIESRQEAVRLVASLKEFEVDLVLDIGANVGQFASEIRQHGYAGRIVSFEPLRDAYAGLQKACARDPKWEAYPKCALGDHEGEVEINVAANSESSSILPMLEAHRKAAPQSAYEDIEKVPLKTLDAVAERYIKEAGSTFLKIDTQGFEWQVLDGAKKILPHVKGILVELSMVPLYEGQHLWREMVDRLEAEGFALWMFKPAFSDPVSGRTLQADGIFFRKS